MRRPEDFYRLPHWEEWQGMSNLHLHRVVSDVCGWEGRCGMLHEAIREDFSDLKPLHIYASGSPSMVYGTLDALVAAGWTRIRCEPMSSLMRPGKAERSLPANLENAGTCPAFYCQRACRCCSSRFL